MNLTMAIIFKTINTILAKSAVNIGCLRTAFKALGLSKSLLSIRKKRAFYVLYPFTACAKATSFTIIGVVNINVDDSGSAI